MSGFQVPVSSSDTRNQQRTNTSAFCSRQSKNNKAPASTPTQIDPQTLRDDYLTNMR
jgi:hypothetical protein